MNDRRIISDEEADDRTERERARLFGPRCTHGKPVVDFCRACFTVTLDRLDRRVGRGTTGGTDGRA